MHDNDNRLIITEEEPQLAIWAVHNTDAVAAIDYCYTVGVWEIMAEAGTPQYHRSRHVILCLFCAHLVRPYLEANLHVKAYGLVDQSMKKPILVRLILFSLFLKQFRLGASTVSRSKICQ